MNLIPKSILPAGYFIVRENAITPNEIIQLRTKVGWSGDTPSRWAECLKLSLAIVGIRNDDKVLVGMGCLVGNVRHAILCDLVVAPEQQGKGLGKALLYERMRIADDINVTYLYTDLSDTNPLRSKYDELGFKNTGSGLFRDRNHIDQS